MGKRLFMKLNVIALSFIIVAVQLFGVLPSMQTSAAVIDYFSPFDVAYSPDGTMIAVSDITKAKLNIITASTGVISNSIQLNGKPKGIAWNGNTAVYVAEYEAGSVAEIDPVAGTVLNRILTGPKPVGLAVSNGKLVVTEFGLKYVSIVDLATRNILGNVTVNDYPYFLDITTNGQYAIVGHATPSGDASTLGFASSVTFVDINAITVASNITLPMGSSNVRDIECSPDGKWAYVAHTLGRTSMPTTQITKGWTNTDAVTIIDVANKNSYTTFLLDTMMEGAADPWGLTISSDSKTLWASISGTHQVYKVDLYNLHLLITGNIPGGTSTLPTLTNRSKAAYPKPYSDIWFKIKADPTKRTLLMNDLGALWSAGLLTKIKMPGQGPRGISIAPNGGKVAVGAYFAGQIYMLDVATSKVTQTINLGSQPAEDTVRRGERTFHDASTTTQKWLSCATCHPEGRADGLDWDMPNDGIGNSKNTKSMYKVFETPPAMWRGAREDAYAGILGGFKYIKFKVPTQQELDDVAAYIQSFNEEVSPYRDTNGAMTADAIAGKAIFESAGTQCATCHTGNNLTDLTIHNVGTKDVWDIDGNYVTPPLEELWRTAPYLHDGSAVTMRDVLTTKNVGDLHGNTSQLTSIQLDQLTAYLLQVTAPTAPDTQAPTAPANLVSTGKTDISISLSWTASTDNVLVTGYDIYSGSTLVGSSTTTTFTVTGLTSNTTYSFTVKAKDFAQNISTESNTLAVTTETPDTQAPTAPTNLLSTGKTDTSVSLSWTASTDDVAVTAYDIYSGSTLVSSNTATTSTVTGLTANTPYTFTVKARDAAGNLSVASSGLTITTNLAIINVALNKTASASSAETANGVVKGNDGSTTTRWCASSGSLNEWWKVDLGGKFNLTSSEITWEEAVNYKYKIETSSDNVTWTMASDKTTSTSATQVQTDTITALNVQYVRITVTGLPTGSWASFFEFKVFGTEAATTQTNVALNKTASASSAQTANGVVKGNDGNTTTRWCASSGSVNQWWTVNLGSGFNLTGSEVTWESDGKNYKYKVETSPDNVTWSMASDKTASISTTQIQTDTFMVSAVQYVRITVTGLSTGSWASFFEFKVFGIEVAALATETPAIVPESETPVIVPESETPAIVPESETPAIVPESETPATIPESGTPVIVPDSETPKTLSRTGMSATATSFELSDPASNVLDGRDATIWQTKLDLSEPLPQSITINLNGTYTVSTLRCLPKQNMNNGRITSYNVYVSLDGINFGSAVATGTWVLDETEKIASFTGVSASYIMLEAVAGSDSLASTAEINVEGY